MSVVAANARTSVVPRPSAIRPKAATLVASPAPPSAGSKIPPHRGPASSSIDLVEDDIVEMKPAPKPSPKPSPKPISRIIPKPVSTIPPRLSTPPSMPLQKIALPKRDPLDVVKEAIGELEYFGTPWQAAGVCVQALMKALGARAAIIHTYDARTTELRVVAAQGPKADVLLGASALVEDDFVGSTVVANKKSMTMIIDGDLPRIAPERLRAMEASKSLVASPAIANGQVVALIEVVDAEVGAAIVEKALAHVGTQLGAFLTKKR